jgi:hypothetical protein
MLLIIIIVLMAAAGFSGVYMIAWLLGSDYQAKHIKR